jgi:hypothetical protein
VQQLGPVYGEAPPVSGISPRFCIGMELGQGLPPALELEGLVGEITEVLLEYDSYKKICCSICTNPSQVDDNYPSKGSLPIPPTPPP